MHNGSRSNVIKIDNFNGVYSKGAVCEEMFSVQNVQHLGESVRKGMFYVRKGTFYVCKGSFSVHERTFNVREGMLHATCSGGATFRATVLVKKLVEQSYTHIHVHTHIHIHTNTHEDYRMPLYRMQYIIIPYIPYTIYYSDDVTLGA